jgi:hypothetical protein
VAFVTFPALSVTVSVAARLPTAPGVNVTAILQLPPKATLPPQLFVVVKSPAFAPLTLILDILNAADPELVSVTVAAVLAVATF